MANRHEVTIAGKTFWVDSNLEERVLLWLENNGFRASTAEYPFSVNYPYRMGAKRYCPRPVNSR